MTQQVFADFIGTTPATLSGIFNDRTRPTLNIVEMIKKKIPDINTDWLMFGSGSMYSSNVTPNTTSSTPRSTSPAPVQTSEQMLDFVSSSSTTPPNVVHEPRLSAPEVRHANGVRNTRYDLLRDDVKILDKPQRRVTEIRVYYDDQTWESFVPSKK